MPEAAGEGEGEERAAPMKARGWRWYPRTAALLFIIAYGVLSLVRLASITTFKNPLWLSAAMLIACSWILFDGLVLERRASEPHGEDGTSR